MAKTTKTETTKQPATKAKVSYLDRVKQKVQDAVDNTQRGNGLEFVPPVGKTKIRLLPPKDENQFFYATHSYNFIPKGSSDGKDTLIWTRKKYDNEKCPIDVAASEFFDSNDEKIRKMGSEIKRKRKFYFNAILVDEPDMEKKFVVLVDNTNEGKLAKQICSAMGLPLMRDTEDNWVVKPSEDSSEDDDAFDLLDFENGYDFIINKTEEATNIGNGRTIKKANFEASKPAKNSRALTEDEMTLLDKRVDLTTHVKYEENVEKVMEALDRYLDSQNGGNNSQAKKKVADNYSKPTNKASSTSKTATAKKPVEDEEVDEEVVDGETQDLLNELEEV